MTGEIAPHEAARRLGAWRSADDGSRSVARGCARTGTRSHCGHGIRLITSRVKRWRGGSMILRWIGAALQELQGHFHRVKGFNGMKELVAALRTRDTSLSPSVDNREVAA